MQVTKFYIPTLKEAPQDAENISHVLMTRGGFIRKLASGIYSFLPIGLRVLRKVEAIVRDEMNKAGAIELFLPSIQPASLWEESGRWDQFGKELLRIKDRHNRQFCYGPTHEEVITDLLRRDLKSYKNLPLTLYQIQTKFRDEVRPRFGLMRGREFLMKDAYSFDVDDDQANISYDKMRVAYNNIFDRIGLKYRIARADSGSIGGSDSEEFMVIANSGEDRIGYCSSCEFAANVDIIAINSSNPKSIDEELEVEKIETPSISTVEELTSKLNIEPANIIKTLFYQDADEQLIAVLVRGDRDVNPLKLAKSIGKSEVLLADKDVVGKELKIPLGFAGPCKLKIDLIADYEVANMRNSVVGANEKDYHLKNVNIDRDFKVSKFADIREIVQNDACPNCESGYLTLTKGIEVAHIFKLGTKYSESLSGKFLDQQGKEQPMVMGCYGIGISRIVASAIEQNHDIDGIRWPVSIAPFEVVIILLSDQPDIVKYSFDLYELLLANGIDVIIDDSSKRAGAKFADADLIGYPVQAIIGKKSLAANQVELKVRLTAERKFIDFDRIVPDIKELLGH